jgi:hypothetical protein
MYQTKLILLILGLLSTTIQSLPTITNPVTTFDDTNSNIIPHPSFFERGSVNYCSRLTDGNQCSVFSHSKDGQGGYAIVFTNTCVSIGFKTVTSRSVEGVYFSPIGYMSFVNNGAGPISFQTPTDAWITPTSSDCDNGNGTWDCVVTFNCAPGSAGGIVP